MMRNYRHALFILILGFSFLLSGCGFQLRGYQQIPPQLHLIYFQSPKPFSAFSVQFKQYLKNFNVLLVNAPMQAPVTVQVTNENFNETLSAISTNTQVRTYSLTFSVTFQIKNRQGKIILPAMTASANTSYNTSDIQLLGDAETLEQLQRQLHQQVISQIFERLNSAQGRAALSLAR